MPRLLELATGHWLVMQATAPKASCLLVIKQHVPLNAHVAAIELLSYVITLITSLIQKLLAITHSTSVNASATASDLLQQQQANGLLSNCTPGKQSP
jgi:hypothetical protein